MELRDYERLPDILPVDRINQMYKMALESFRKNEVIKSNFLKILTIITERQIMTYELLEMGLKDEIDNLLCEIWNTDSYDDVDAILYIVVNLGLEKCFNKAKNSIQDSSNISDMIRNEIVETVEEVGDNILNPYYDLKR